MTTATMSVYPPAIEKLLPAALELAEQLGGVPSRNELMRTFKIGVPKATTLRRALVDITTGLPADDTPTQPHVSTIDTTTLVVEPEPELSTADTPDPAMEPEPVIDPEPVDTPDAIVQPVPVVEPNAHRTRLRVRRTVATGRRSRLDDPFLPLIDPDLDVPVEPPTEAAEPVLPETAPEVETLAAPVGHPVPNITTPHLLEALAGLPPVPESKPQLRKRLVVWPVLPLALPAFVAIWSGWVELGQLSGFGMVRPLPGIVDNLQINSAITLPIGVETYAAYALYVWLSGRAPKRAHRFAMWSAIGSLLFGAAGQVAYHLIKAAGLTSAPWLVTAIVACLPVIVLGMGAALAHLLRADDTNTIQETGALA